MGRTASRPDLLCLGKGITGGYLPLSATVASGRVFEAFAGPDLGPQTFYHGHSYGGNALACAVALRHLELLEAWDVLANVTTWPPLWATASGHPIASSPGWQRSASGASWSGWNWLRRRRRSAGAGGCAPGGLHAGCCSGRSGDVVVVMPPS